MIKSLRIDGELLNLAIEQFFDAEQTETQLKELSANLKEINKNRGWKNLKARAIKSLRSHYTNGVLYQPSSYFLVNFKVGCALYRGTNPPNSFRTDYFDAHPKYLFPTWVEGEIAVDSKWKADLQEHHKSRQRLGHDKLVPIEVKRLPGELPFEFFEWLSQNLFIKKNLTDTHHENVMGRIQRNYADSTEVREYRRTPQDTYSGEIIIAHQHCVKHRATNEIQQLDIPVNTSAYDLMVARQYRPKTTELLGFDVFADIGR